MVFKFFATSTLVWIRRWIRFVFLYAMTSRSTLSLGEQRCPFSRRYEPLFKSLKKSSTLQVFEHGYHRLLSADEEQGKIVDQLKLLDKTMVDFALTPLALMSPASKCNHDIAKTPEECEELILKHLSNMTVSDGGPARTHTIGSQKLNNYAVEKMDVYQENKKTRLHLENIHSILNSLAYKQVKAMRKIEKIYISMKKFVPIEKPFEEINTIGDLRRFEQRLGADKQYYDAVAGWLKSSIDRELDVREQLEQAMEFIFDMRFLAQCTWTDIGMLDPEMHATTEIVNILNLLQEVGRCRDVAPELSYVGKMFIYVIKFAKKKCNTKYESARRNSV